MTEPNVISIKTPIALTITKEINGLWSALLEIKKDDYIKTECYVEIENELYISKTIEKLKTKSGVTFQVQLEHNMTELNGYFIGPFIWTDKTCAEMLTLALTGTPWTVGVTDISGTQTIESNKKISVLAALQLIVQAFIGELYFHSKPRIVDIKNEIGTAHKLPIRYDKNSDYIKKIENSEKLCTRLYIYGEGDYATEGIAGNLIWALREDTDYIYAVGTVINKCFKYLKSDMSFVAASPSYEDTIYALTEDATHVYIAGGYTARKICKYLKSDLSLVKEGPDLSGIIFALVNDANYIYYAGTVTERVYKYKKSDLYYEASGPWYGGPIRVLAEDDNFIYCGGYTLDPTVKIWKLQKSNLAKVDESPEIDDGIWGLAVDDTYVYACGGNEKKIYKYLKSNMSFTAESSAQAGRPGTLTEDTNYIYASIADGINKVYKFNKSNMLKVAESPDYGTPIYALTEDANYIYAGGGEAVVGEEVGIISKVCKYLKSDMSLVKEAPNYGSIGYLESEYINDYKYVKEQTIYTNIDDAQRLLAYGQLYIATYGLPLRSYIVNIQDKVAFPEWGSEILDIGDTIRIYDNDLKTNEDVRIKRFVKDLTNPVKTTVELVNTIERITDLLSKLNYTVKNVTYDNNITSLDIRDSVIKDTVLKDVTFSGSSYHYGKATLMFMIPGELTIGSGLCMPIPMPYTCYIDKVYIYVFGAPENAVPGTTCIIVQIYVNNDPIFITSPIEVRPHIHHLAHFDEVTPNFPRINKDELVYPGILLVGDLVPGTDLVVQLRCR